MKLILLKLGGSLITEKDKAYTARPEVISAVISQIRLFLQSKSDIDLIIGNGGGSFPHQSAVKYDTVNGFLDDESPYGACLVHTDAMQLNYILTRECIKQHLPVYSFQPSALFLTENKKTLYPTFSPIEQALKSNIVPCVYGDCILDTKIGSTIYSTEEILSMIAIHFLEKKRYDSISIIHAGRFDGVLDANRNVIEHITPENYDSIQKHITNSLSPDVTGGMLKKVQESLRMAEKNIDSYIINGEKDNSIFNALTMNFQKVTHIHNS